MGESQGDGSRDLVTAEKPEIARIAEDKFYCGSQKQQTDLDFGSPTERVEAGSVESLTRNLRD